MKQTSAESREKFRNKSVEETLERRVDYNHGVGRKIVKSKNK
jgi:hypothetical protein